jgi:hypothetical protein
VLFIYGRVYLWKILTILEVPENFIEVLKRVDMDVTINFRVSSSSRQAEASKAIT